MYPTASNAFGTWRYQIYPYVKSTGVYKCPSNSSTNLDPASDNVRNDPNYKNQNFYPTGQQFSCDYQPLGDTNQLPGTGYDQPQTNGIANWPLMPDSGLPPGSGGDSGTFPPMNNATVNRPSQLIMLAEATTPWYSGLGPTYFGGTAPALYAGHTNNTNYLFCDGHVKAMRPTQTCNGTDDYWSNWNTPTVCPGYPNTYQFLQLQQAESFYK